MGYQTAVYYYALQVLADGQWHDYDKTVWEVAKGVPPQIAIRKAENSRKLAWLRSHPGKTKADVPPRKKGQAVELQIRTGAKAMARSVLSNIKFEHVMLEDTKQKLVRIRPDIPTPLPEGVIEHRKNTSRSAWAHMTPEEKEKAKSERARKGFEARLRKQGIDPATYKSVKAQRAERSREYRNMTPEERHQFHSEKAKRGWETVQRKKKEADG